MFKILKTTFFVALIGLATCILFSCDRADSPSEDNSSSFKTSDFKIAITNSHVSNNGEMIINYTVTNTTNMDYNNNKDGSFRVKFKAKTTTNVTYEYDSLIGELSAGTTKAESALITPASGQTIDANTMTYYVYLF